MRKKLKKYNFIILSVFVMTGMSMTGWALAFNYENLAETAYSQKELKNKSQVTHLEQLVLDHSNIIWVLVCTGLIGFFGVRRQSKKSENFVKIKHSECSPHVDSLAENNPEGQACRGKLNIPDTCILNESCSV